MLREVKTENFSAEPTFHKNMAVIRYKNSVDNQMLITNNEIDELIELLMKAKLEFK